MKYTNQGFQTEPAYEGSSSSTSDESAFFSESNQKSADDNSESAKIQTIPEFEKELSEFVYDSQENKHTAVVKQEISNISVNKYINEFWTSKQRDASSIHEVSYRACFKPQLPRFFIDRLTKKGDYVYDPFGGRGTTIIESVLSGRRGVSNDINPLSEIFAYPRINIPSLKDIEQRISEIPFDDVEPDIDLSMFYHEDTLLEILSLRNYLSYRKEKNQEDDIDKWIRMTATNRLTGHSSGFFSVYTLPPNQAVSPERQIKINQQRNQTPEYRDVKKLILKKSRQLINGITDDERRNISRYGRESFFVNEDARHTPEIEDESIQLTATSPPFLDIVQYSSDNWLRCWFNCLSADEIKSKITVSKTVSEWSDVMGDVFHELYRITKPGGWVAFEVGEVRNGTVMLDETAVPLGVDAGFRLFGILINDQIFTKTANIWGIHNRTRGTNSNRIVIFRKE